MNRTRRLLRLYLTMLVIILLPLAGFLWSVPGYQVYVALIGAACFVLIAASESIMLVTEREAMALRLKLNQDEGDLDQWKEKVRELERVVGMMARENDAYRREELDRSVHAVKSPPVSAA